MARSNRQQRRRAQRGRGHDPVIPPPVTAMSGILPGLPGGPPYNTDEERAAVMDEVYAAVRELHPGDEARKVQIERLGISGRRVLRHKREAVPGIGEGVLLGEFEEERPRGRLDIGSDGVVFFT